MARKLNQREKRILVVGLVVAAAIVGFHFGPKVVGHWQQVRANLKVLQSKMNDIGPSKAQQAALAAVVPVFDTPQPEDKQKFLFRDKLYEQIKKAGINNIDPLSFLTAQKRVDSYKTLLIKCKGKCKFDQLLDFLATVKENPYLMGVEELRIQCDTKQPPEKRQEVEIDLTVSTLVQDTLAKLALKTQQP